MDEIRRRIHDDLRGMLAGDVLTHELEIACWSFDAGLYEVRPLAVVAPRSRDDVTVLCQYATENEIALNPRGGGTGLAGECLGGGIAVDLSRYLRRVLEIGDDEIVVQPGLTVDELNAVLEPMGRRFGPDPGGSDCATIGGIIAADAAGSKSQAYGTTGDHVHDLEIVFAHGETAVAKRETWPEEEGTGAEGEGEEGFKTHLLRKLRVLHRRYGELIEKTAMRSPRNRAGYAFAKATSAAGVDLARLISGSEGTLAIVTKARLRTVRIPSAQAVVGASFGRIASAAEAVAACLEEFPAACDLFDRRLVSLAREDELIRDASPESAEALLLVEFEGDDRDRVEAQATALKRRLERTGDLASDPFEVTRLADCRRLMSLRRRVLPQLLRTALPGRAAPLIEDASVPVAALPAFLQTIQTVFKDMEVSGTIYAHAGAGQVHARPFLNMADPRDRDKVETISERVHAAVLALGGSVSGEHGLGLARTKFMKRQYGELFNLFREIKEAFDPKNLLNPGHVVFEDPEGPKGSLKALVAGPGPPPPPPPRGPPPPGPRPPPPPRRGGASGEPGPEFIPVELLRWSGDSMIETANACNGCGACRSSAPELRMCPTFRALRTEVATPRAHANLLRLMAAGAIDPRLWSSEEMRANANLCVHCELCRVECPTGVDVSALMLEAKAAYALSHGLPAGDWMLSRTDLWAAWASAFPVQSNLLLRNRTVRALLERFFGLSRHRRLPKARRNSFVARADRLGLCSPRPELTGPRVAYFLDVFANHFDHDLAETTIAILQKSGVNVLVPKGQKGCGMPALVAGDLERARDLALANLRVLGNAVREGYTVICTEPTAALMLKREYLRLTDDLDAALVAENTLDAGRYLAGLNERGMLPRPNAPLELRVGYHQPCHQRSLEDGMPGYDLLRSIPGLDAHFINQGCSGMAGTYGMTAANFRTSLKAGRGLLQRLRQDDIRLGASECGACRMQMEQGANKWAEHPIKILGLAMGLKTELRERIKTPKPRRHVQ